MKKIVILLAVALQGEGSKAQKSLINDPRVKEIRTLLSTLKIEHPKVKCLVEILRGKISEQLVTTTSCPN